MRDEFWLQGMMGGIKPAYDCIKQFSETDFTEDLKKFDVPTLIAHGDDDQIVPIGAAAMMSSKLVKGATLKVYQGVSPRPRADPRGRVQRRPAGLHQRLVRRSARHWDVLPRARLTPRRSLLLGQHAAGGAVHRAVGASDCCSTLAGLPAIVLRWADCMKT